jgi:hypothetical protein
MSVTYLQLIIFLVIGDVSIKNKALLVINFVNLKIKLTRSFEYVHMGRVWVLVFIEGCSYVYE